MQEIRQGAMQTHHGHLKAFSLFSLSTLPLALTSHDSGLSVTARIPLARHASTPKPNRGSMSTKSGLMSSNRCATSWVIRRYSAGAQGKRMLSICVVMRIPPQKDGLCEIDTPVASRQYTCQVFDLITFWFEMDALHMPSVPASGFEKHTRTRVRVALRILPV